jgi:alpha-beta hydrolase superfamily lysophospholipase
MRSHPAEGDEISAVPGQAACSQQVADDLADRKARWPLVWTTSATPAVMLAKTKSQQTFARRRWEMWLMTSSAPSRVAAAAGRMIRGARESQSLATWSVRSPASAQGPDLGAAARAGTLASLRGAGGRVLLVRGLGGTTSGWNTMVGALRAHGLAVAAISYQPFGTSVEHLAEQLAEAVGLLLQETGAEKVHMVAHSLGGVVIAQALADGLLAGQVDVVVAIASPLGVALGEPPTNRRDRPSAASRVAPAAPPRARTLAGRCALAGHHRKPRGLCRAHDPARLTRASRSWRSTASATSGCV